MVFSFCPILYNCHILDSARFLSASVAAGLLSAYHQRSEILTKPKQTGKEESETYLLGSKGLGSRFSLSTVLPSIMRIRGVPGE
jgi:hypothetical protein